MKEKISQMTDLAFNLYPTIRKSFRSLVALKSLPLSTTQLACLNTIDTMQKCTMSALAKKLQMSNQQLTKVVDALVDMGAVERSYNEKNRRQILVYASEKGKKLLLDLRAEVTKKLTILGESLPSNESQALFDSILNLLYNLKNLDEKYKN
ncbi:MAG: MarR family transcriptional regulator [Clostridia bacterium]|nr:MarR family transcriptional regulator [Clostridia bacterium]